MQDIGNICESLVAQIIVYKHCFYNICFCEASDKAEGISSAVLSYCNEGYKRLSFVCEAA